MKRLLRAVAACSAVLLATAAAAATLVVGPGQRLSQLLRSAADGDTIELPAGEYRGEVGVILQKRLTLRGTGGRAVLHADGRHAEGKAILVVRDGDLLIENIEFRGARVPDGNGAGIRFENGRLVVRRCVFVDNENGILTANFGDAELTVEDSEFAQAPAGRRLPHLLYVGRIARFTLTGSHLHGGQYGHLLKSRARENHVRYNRLVDDAAGRAAYELEFPNGGVAFVVGNIIGQAPGTTNATIVSFGAEGSDDREQALFMAHNTLINEGLRPGPFVHVHQAKLTRPVETRYVNNLSVGFGAGELGLADISQGNFTALPGHLQDVEAGRYALRPDSLLRGRGVEPGTARGVSLAPQAEFTPPVGTRPLPARTRWSPGANPD
jgi:hypothetical protein